MADPFVWQETVPEDVRMSTSALDALRDGLAERGTRSLLIVRHDRIAYEWYAPGRDATQRHYTASLAKALVTIDPVVTVDTFDAGGLRVGYIDFRTFVSTADAGSWRPASSLRY